MFENQTKRIVEQSKDKLIRLLGVENFCQQVPPEYSCRALKDWASGEYNDCDDSVVLGGLVWETENFNMIHVNHAQGRFHARLGVVCHPGIPGLYDELKGITNKDHMNRLWGISYNYLRDKVKSSHPYANGDLFLVEIDILPEILELLHDAYKLRRFDRNAFHPHPAHIQKGIIPETFNTDYIREVSLLLANISPGDIARIDVLCEYSHSGKKTNHILVFFQTSPLTKREIDFGVALEPIRRPFKRAHSIVGEAKVSLHLGVTVHKPSAQMFDTLQGLGYAPKFACEDTQYPRYLQKVVCP